jgi:hypothetical protein
LDVLVEQFASPLYTAFTLLCPELSVDVLKLAFPNASNVDVPSIVFPCLKLTVPVGTIPVGDETLTLKITVWPTADGFGVELSTEVVVTRLTTCVKLAEVLVANCVSPLYAAVTFEDPAGKLPVLNIAWPPLRGAVPRTVLPPIMKVTVPVGVPAEEEVIAAVNVTTCVTVDGFKDELIAVLVAVGATTF